MSRRDYSASAVFVDSSAYCAVTVERDANYVESRALLRRLTVERYQLVTTNLVLAETHSLILNRSERSQGGHKAREQSLQTIQAIYDSAKRGGTRLEYVTLADEARTLEILTAYTDKSFSFTDASSFAVMERLGLTIAFTFDADFQQYGFIKCS